MPDTQLNLRIDQLDLGEPKEGDFGVFRDMAAAKTKRYLIPILKTSQNFEWQSDINYPTNSVVTYGSTWWQSISDDNTNVIPGTNSSKWVAMTKGSAGSWWTAGAYPEDQPYVLYKINGSVYFFELVNPQRPFASTNFVNELLAGDWKVFGSVDYVNSEVNAGVVDLNFLNLESLIFLTLVPISAETIASITNFTNAKKGTWIFTIENNAPIQFASIVKMSDARTDENKKWTPFDNGTYKAEIVKYGNDWIVEITGPFN